MDGRKDKYGDDHEGSDGGENGREDGDENIDEGGEREPGN